MFAKQFLKVVRSRAASCVLRKEQVLPQKQVLHWCIMSQQISTQFPTIIKSPNDKREYREIRLENGLRAVLISDLDGEDECPMEDEDQSDSDIDSEHSSDDEEEEDEMDAEVDEGDGQTDSPTGEKKSAAALSIGVGGFSDPPDIPGFAHFLEHMVFMGSEKYPTENNFDDYLGRHGGGSNAWTDHERTCFYFDVERNYFSKALDKWAQFFVSPLLLQDSVDREIEAVDSEFQERKPSDVDRLNQLMVTTATKDNPMSKFLLGNADTLKHTPAANGIDVYGRLRDFYNKHYTAQYMTLTIQSKHSLDTLEAWVRESFSGIHNNGKPPVSFVESKEPFKTEAFKKMFKVIPVENTHKLYITWAFPPLHHQYKVKPLEYISALLTHEGEGSLYSLLKQRTWALEFSGGNSGDGFDMNTVWSGFDVCVTLTEQGLEHVNEVIQTIFEYIHLMKKHGPQQWFYDELKTMEENKFRWKEQGDATDYVEKVCDNMQLYPSQHYLTGHNMLLEFNQELIRDCMDLLRADNCNIMLTSSNYTEKECSLKESWFGTQYSVEEISPELLSLWSDAKENTKLHLPKANKFLASDFSLKSVATNEQSFVPKLIASSSHHKLFYKKDSKFNVPKGYIYCYLKSPDVCDSLKSATAFDVFVHIVNQNMAEPTYPALMAGYELGFSVEDSQSGLVMEVDGFNHKLQDVLGVMLKLLVNFSCEDDLFKAIKTELKKLYYNSLIKPYDTAKMVRYSIIEERYWASIDKYRIIDTITKEDVLTLHKQLLQHVFVETLVVGNFTQKEAKAICNDVMSKLKGQTQIDCSALLNRTVELPYQQTYCQVQGYNPDDSNSSITNYYQSTPGNLKKSCLNQLLVTRMTEPCFNTLRTKQQLGYSVWCVNFHTCGVIGLGICIEYQAQKFSMAHVDEQIEKFMLEMKDILTNTTQDEFTTLVESVVTLKKIEDTHLEQEASRYWREVVEETYLFDRQYKEIEVLQTVTLRELQDWFTDEYLGDKQRKLSVQVVGSLPGSGNISMLLKDSDDHYIRCLEDPEQSEKLAVTNVPDYKHALTCFPHTKIIC